MERLAAHSYLDLADSFMSPNSSIKVVSLGAAMHLQKGQVLAIFKPQTITISATVKELALLIN